MFPCQNLAYVPSLPFQDCAWESFCMGTCAKGGDSAQLRANLSNLQNHSFKSSVCVTRGGERCVVSLMFCHLLARAAHQRTHCICIIRQQMRWQVQMI